jgi:hypothetical protein
MFWVYTGIVAVLGAIWALNRHELSHCVVVWMKGGRVTSYKPWPHKVGDNWKFGRMTYIINEVPSRKFSLCFYAAPLMSALFFLFLWLSLALLVWKPLLGVAAWEAADVVNWAFGYVFKRATNDGGRFRIAKEG